MPEKDQGIIVCGNMDCHYYSFEEPDSCDHPFKAISECIDADIRRIIPKKKDFYIAELMSTECQCGKPKKRGKSVCYSCWCKLPHDIQVDLYSHMGDGYEEAYEAAIKFLTEG